MIFFKNKKPPTPPSSEDVSDLKKQIVQLMDVVNEQHHKIDALWLKVETYERELKDTTLIIRTEYDK